MSQGVGQATCITCIIEFRLTFILIFTHLTFVSMYYANMIENIVGVLHCKTWTIKRIKVKVEGVLIKGNFDDKINYSSNIYMYSVIFFLKKRNPSLKKYQSYEFSYITIMLYYIFGWIQFTISLNLIYGH